MQNTWQNPWEMTPEELKSKWSHVLEKTRDIFTWTSPSELCFLCEAASRATNILEIGSYHGKSALVMALANPDAQMTCIDNGENAEVPATFRRNLSEQINSGHLRFIENTSRWLALNKQKRKFDLIWIDAGHQEDDVTTDVQNSMPHLAPGGLLCGHDWRKENMDDGVNKAVQKAFGVPRVFESIWQAPVK